MVVGSSSGIGKELVKHFSELNYEVIGISRRESENCIWIEADISTKEGILKISKNLENKHLDGMIFSTGIWEEYGFMKEFKFLKTSRNETQNIMEVNLIAPIEITKAVSKNLSLSKNPRAVYLGALCGVDNLATNQVAYNASKFGLRGAIQSLRIALSEQNIGFTVINPGNVGTEEVLEDIKEGRFDEQIPISMKDIIKSMEFIFSLSSNVEITDINLVQKDDFKSY